MGDFIKTVIIENISMEKVDTRTYIWYYMLYENSATQLYIVEIIYGI